MARGPKTTGPAMARFARPAETKQGLRENFEGLLIIKPLRTVAAKPGNSDKGILADKAQQLIYADQTIGSDADLRGLMANPCSSSNPKEKKRARIRNE
jgi:hypothetical protein